MKSLASGRGSAACTASDAIASVNSQQAIVVDLKVSFLVD
jgi:hypothetical protein